MQPEHPAIYLLRLAVATIGVITLAGLMYLAYLRLLHWGNSREKELLGKRSIPHYELRNIGYLSLALREGQATFAAPRLIAGAGFAAGFSLVLIPAIVHLVYTLVITILNLSFMTGAPVDPRLPASMYPWPIFRDNITTIARYLPSLLLMGIVYGIFSVAFAIARQRMAAARIHWQFLGIDMPGSWLVGIPLGALFYFLAGAFSHERVLGWLLTQYIIWAVAAYAIPLYLHRMEDTLLYWLTRFDWESRTVAAARYILLDRFSQPAPGLVQARSTDGYLLVDAELPPQDVSVFIGLAAQLPGVEKVELRMAGQPAGSAGSGSGSGSGSSQGYSLLREAAALRGERRHGHPDMSGPEAGLRGKNESETELLPSPGGGAHPATTRKTQSLVGPGARDRRYTLAVQFVLFVAGSLLLGVYFYGPAMVRYFWPQRVFGPSPPPGLPAGLELTADLSLASFSSDASPTTVVVTPAGLLALLASDGRLWTWSGAGQTLSQAGPERPIQPQFHLLAMLPGERVTRVAPAPDSRLFAAIGNDSQPADGMPALVWIDPDTGARTDLPPLSPSLFSTKEESKIRLVQLAVDHQGRPYAAVAVGTGDSASFLVLGLFGQRWQVVFSGPGLLGLIPSYQDGLPLIALMAGSPALRRLGYGDQSPFQLRGHSLPPGTQWTAAAMTAAQYLTLCGPENTLVQIAPDGYPIAYLEAGRVHQPPSPTSPVTSSPSIPQVVAWSDPDTGSEWVGVFSQGRLRVYQPDTIGRLVRLAYRLEGRNQLVEATAVWQNVLRAAPALPQAHLALGKAYFERQDWLNAAKEFYWAGNQEWLGRALAGLDSQTRRDHLLPLLLGGVAFLVLSAIISFLDSERRGVRGMSGRP